MNNPERYSAMRSVGDRVLVRPDPKPQTSSGGIVIPATALVSEKMRYGDVLSVGARVEHVKPGHRIAWQTRSGDFADGSQGYELMSLHEADVVAIL